MVTNDNYPWARDCYTVALTKLQTKGQAVHKLYKARESWSLSFLKVKLCNLMRQRFNSKLIKQYKLSSSFLILMHKCEY